MNCGVESVDDRTMIGLVEIEWMSEGIHGE